jgi:hypothetical protein
MKQLIYRYNSFEKLSIFDVNVLFPTFLVNHREEFNDTTYRSELSLDSRFNIIYSNSEINKDFRFFRIEISLLGFGFEINYQTDYD